MKKGFFNIIPGKESDAILIYGDIGDWEDVRAKDIVTEILTATYTGRKIDIRINSNGGVVSSGIAIFNAIRNSKSDITIYIDGVAASIAGLLIATGKPVKMSRYARLMIHSVQGGAWGTAKVMRDTADEILSLEDTIAEILSVRTKLTIDEFKAQYFDGADHWLTADEALRLGFIDEIYDADPIDLNLKPMQVYEHYLNKYTNQFNNETTTEMIEVKKKLGLTDTATEEDVLAKISEMETRAASTDKDATIAELTNKLTAYQQKEIADNEAAITAFVDKAVADNKITEAQKPHFVNVLKADRTNGEAIINSLAQMRRAKDLLNSGSVGEESAWDKRKKEIEENNKKR